MNGRGNGSQTGIVGDRQQEMTTPLRLRPLSSGDRGKIVGITNWGFENAITQGPPHLYLRLQSWRRKTGYREGTYLWHQKKTLTLTKLVMAGNKERGGH